jgi:AcrR family transcriptional regulator
VETAKRKWTRSPAREARYENERKAIIRAAYRLVGRDRGFVSVQEILESAELSTRAFYRHFSSKDELVLSMYRSDNERVSAALWAATESEPDAWEALRAWVDVSLSVVYDPGPKLHSKVLGSAEVRSAEGWSREYVDGVRRSMASLEELLERGARNGTFQMVRPGPDAHVIFGTTQHFTSLRMADGDAAMTRQQALDAVMDTAHRMVANGPEGIPTPSRRRRPTGSVAAVAD